jgi:hypothetical protein
VAAVHSQIIERAVTVLKKGGDILAGRHGLVQGFRLHGLRVCLQEKLQADHKHQAKEQDIQKNLHQKNTAGGVDAFHAASFP